VFTEIEWFSLESGLKPNDGAFVLVCSKGGKWTYYARYKDEAFLAENSAVFHDFNKGGGPSVHLPAKPTHWAYLPHIDGVSQR
jgi:hypothetical protein